MNREFIDKRYEILKSKGLISDQERIITTVNPVDVSNTLMIILSEEGKRDHRPKTLGDMIQTIEDAGRYTKIRIVESAYNTDGQEMPQHVHIVGILKSERSSV